MLSLDNLINYLEPKQIKINSYNKESYNETTNEKVTNKSFKDIPIYLRSFFKENTNFSFFRNQNISKNDFFNFINSILICIDNQFSVQLVNDKNLRIKSFFKKLIVDFDEKNLYYKFNYNKNRKIKKCGIQEYLYNILKLSDKKMENLSKNYVDQLICDYLGINIVIFNVMDNKLVLDKSRVLYTMKYEGLFNKFVPTIFIIDNGLGYNCILSNKSDKSLVRYSEERELLNNIFKNLNICIKRKEYEGKTLDDLRELCKENNIEITKISSQTKKKINKKKIELINDLGKLDFI